MVGHPSMLGGPDDAFVFISPRGFGDDFTSAFAGIINTVLPALVTQFLPTPDPTTRASAPTQVANNPSPRPTAAAPAQFTPNIPAQPTALQGVSTPPAQVPVNDPVPNNHGQPVQTNLAVAPATVGQQVSSNLGSPAAASNANSVAIPLSSTLNPTTFSSTMFSSGSLGTISSDSSATPSANVGGVPSGSASSQNAIAKPKVEIIVPVVLGVIIVIAAGLTVVWFKVIKKRRRKKETAVYPFNSEETVQEEGRAPVANNRMSRSEKTALHSALNPPRNPTRPDPSTTSSASTSSLLPTPREQLLETQLTTMIRKLEALEAEVARGGRQTSESPVSVPALTSIAYRVDQPPDYSSHVALLRNDGLQGPLVRPANAYVGYQ